MDSARVAAQNPSRINDESHTSDGFVDAPSISLDASMDDNESQITGVTML